MNRKSINGGKAEGTRDWKWVKLGEVCEFIGGGTPSKKVSNYWGGNINWASVKDVKGEYLNTTEDLISDIGLRNSASNIAEPNDVILITRISPGKVIISNIRTAINQDLKIVKPKFKTTSKFIAYYFQSVEKELIRQSSGTTVLGITLANLNEIKIPLLDIESQNLIISKIEELFSELDKGIENLRIAQRQLKTYRQAVLNDSITQGGNQPIESIIDKLDQGWSPKCENQSSTNEDEWAVIKTSAIQPGHFVDFENKKLPSSLKPRRQHEIKSGDILITRAGPRVRVGVCCMVKDVRPNLINCDKVYRIKVDKSKIMPEFFELVFNAPRYQDEIEQMKTGISDSGLNLTQKSFLKIEIPVPSLEGQQNVVQTVKNLLSVADKLEECITQSLQQAEALRQSILKNAFEGRLV